MTQNCRNIARCGRSRLCLFEDEALERICKIRAVSVAWIVLACVAFWKASAIVLMVYSQRISQMGLLNLLLHLPRVMHYGSSITVLLLKLWNSSEYSATRLSFVQGLQFFWPNLAYRWLAPISSVAQLSYRTTL